MYLLYLDDSGSAQNKKESHLVLGGFSVFERQLHWLSSKLDELAQHIFPQDPNAIEFHASHIFSGKIAPWKDMSKPARRDVIKSVLKIFSESHLSTVAFACAVHKDSFPNQDPMELAFEDLCSRFDMQLKRFYARGNQQRGIIIVDESSYETSLQRLTLNFRSLGMRWGKKLVNVAEVPLFVDSKACRAIQIADHIAYSVFRRYESQDNSYFDIIASRFDSEQGRLHGLVHKHLHLSDCICLACASNRTVTVTSVMLSTFPVPSTASE
ncbi:MAG TPA: DUF3800 domain-containing protein [Thermoanaerobaculia bacterium]|jgi:hypothetical protein|nr:DUF3800 domain-containing protein [Thermoanaerobaculia bacterium]